MDVQDRAGTGWALPACHRESQTEVQPSYPTHPHGAVELDSLSAFPCSTTLDASLRLSLPAGMVTRLDQAQLDWSWPLRAQAGGVTADPFMCSRKQGCHQRGMSPQGTGYPWKPGGGGPCSPKAHPLGHLVPTEQPPQAGMGLSGGAGGGQGRSVHLEHTEMAASWASVSPVLSCPPALRSMPVLEVSKGHLLCLPTIHQDLP